MAPGDFHSTEQVKAPTVTEWEEHGHIGGDQTKAAYKRVDKPDYAVLVDEPDANTTYIGESVVGATTSDSVWQIKKITVSGTLTTIAYADGDSQYDNIWDNRASLSYS